MKKYEKYKESGIEWIGEIPSHWEKVKIKQLAFGKDTLFLDGDWIESKEIVFNDTNIRYITTGNIGEGKYKEQGSGFITEETFQKLNCTEVFSHDLVISRLNPPIGRACIIPDLGKRIVTSVDNVILRPNKKYSKRYLVHFFSNQKYHEFTLLEGRGATMQRISRGILGNIQIVVPSSLSEQTAIASYLDRKISEIDELIADKKRLLELYEEEKTAIINELVTGKKVWDGNAWAEPAKVKDSGIEWLGEIPEHWEVKKVKHLVTKVGSGVTPSGGASVYKQSGIPLLRSQNIQLDGLKLDDVAYITQEIHETMKNSQVHEGDILLNITGASIGRVYYVEKELGEANVNQHVCIIRPKPQMATKFLYFVIRSNIGQEQIRIEQTGSGREGLNFEALKNFNMPFLCIEEQQSIVHHIETECNRINTQIERTKKLIDLLTEYRTALISEVVTGKIKVGEYY